MPRALPATQPQLGARTDDQAALKRLVLGTRNNPDPELPRHAAAVEREPELAVGAREAAGAD